MTINDDLNRMADQYDGEGVPFFFAGVNGVRLIGHSTAENVHDAKPSLDAALRTNKLDANYLSSFKTPKGNLGFVAHG